MRLVVSAWTGSDNLGDELIFAALRDKLSARGVSSSVISIDPEATARVHDVRAIGHRDLPGIVRELGTADALVLGGGGLLQDETSHLNVPYHLSRVWLARLRRKPFGALGLGVGALDTSLSRLLVKRTLRGHRGIAVRDRESAALLARLGVEGVVIAADLVFSLPAPPVEQQDRLVVCLRAWPRRGRLLPMSARWKQDLGADRVFRSLASALDRAADATGLHVRFVAFQQSRDDLIHHRVAAHMRSTVSLSAPSVHEVLAEVGTARAVITMRYHGAIAACLHGRPTIVIGGSSKLGSLREELGPGATLQGRDAESLAALPQALDRVMPHGEAVVEACARFRQRERGNDVILERLLGG